MSYLIKPENYTSLLDLNQTEVAIKQIKDFFEKNIAEDLHLRRVTAPLFVLQGTGINDDLNGVERAVTFPIKDLQEAKAEVVHSLAKWKRLMLAQYKINEGNGLYTDMNAIRTDENLGNMHSLYVDQWDWERTIFPEERNVEFLKEIVRAIYNVLLKTEKYVYDLYPHIKPVLPAEIKFLSAEELMQLYPDLTPKQREDKIAKQYGAVFLMGIGGVLSDGEKHDGRAPDYDDWSTKNSDGFEGLNGDILVWDDVLNCSLELSSMGIRVDKISLERQLEITDLQNRKTLFYHKKLMAEELPLSIGGGIGQSRLCMFFLKKAHIGETQASIWPEDMKLECSKLGMELF